MALCSESTGTIWPGRAARVTIGPPTIRLSLLASARVLPARSAARVGRRPIDPVMPLSTTSAPCAATSSEAPSPTTTRGAYDANPASRAVAVIAPRTAVSSPSATPTSSTCSRTACSARRARLRPPALSAVAVNRSGLRVITSIAWVPMEPVEPRSATVRWPAR